MAAQQALMYYQSGMNAQLLTTVNNTGDISVDSLNQMLHSAVNPYRAEAPYVANQKECFWIGNRVLVTQNLWELGCCNGDVGSLRMFPAEAPTAVATLDLPDGRCCYFRTQQELSCLRHAYALTVHKAQGSEFDTVILPVTWGMRHMLNRNLLYTAISRARKEVVIVGSWRALEYAMNNPAPDRKSSLTEWTKEAMNDQEPGESDD